MSSTGAVFDRTIALMQDRLNLNSLNQKVIAGNVANINTPGYVSKDLSFDETLREALEDQVLTLVRSNENHFDQTDPVAAMRSPEVVGTGPVDLDREMVKLARNNVEYQYMVTMLNKKFGLLKQAVTEGAS